jgi:hypothetical protein
MASVKNGLLFILVFLLASCSTTPPTDSPTTTPTPESQPYTLVTLVKPSATMRAKQTVPPTLDDPVVLNATLAAPVLILTPPTGTEAAKPPLDWKSLPIIPMVQEQVKQIYQRGLELGNDPHAFSKIGGCGSTPAWFLGDFDRGEKFYKLGEYTALAGVIQQYQGSFGRTSLAARAGFNAASLFVPLWSDRSFCQANETPLACEYRVHRPVIAFIMLGSNDVWHPTEFEPQMRKIIEYSIQNGVIPILSTKADNAEGDGSINATIARLAQEYNLPLWNFWRAVEGLPDQGLQEDKVHLTWGRSLFDDPNEMTKAWPWRNLTALQVLDAVWKVLNS